MADQLGALLRHIFLDPRTDHLGMIEERGLSMTQVRVLVTLACLEGPLSAGDLAERLGLSPAAMSRAIDGLVSRELVSRSESAQDRRVRLLEISSNGEAFVDEIVALRNIGLERFVADLTSEQRLMLSQALVAIEADRSPR